MIVMTHSASRLLSVFAAAVTLAASFTAPRPPAPSQTKTLDTRTQLETGRTRQDVPHPTKSRIVTASHIAPSAARPTRKMRKRFSTWLLVVCTTACATRDAT